MCNQDNTLRLNKEKQRKLTVEGRPEAHRRVVCTRGCEGMQKSTPHGKSLTEESAGKEPERRQVCLNVEKGGWRV